MPVSQLAVTLRVLAVIPIVAGLASMLLGAGAVPGRAADVNLESELRYYGAFYAGFGLFLWWIAGSIASRGRELRLAAAVLFCGGLARALGIAVDGRPAADYLVLLALELTLPVVLVLWHRRASAG